MFLEMKNRSVLSLNLVELHLKIKYFPAYILILVCFKSAFRVVKYTVIYTHAILYNFTIKMPYAGQSLSPSLPGQAGEGLAQIHSPLLSTKDPACI